MVMWRTIDTPIFDTYPCPRLGRNCCWGCRSRLLPLARHDPAGAFDPPPGDMEGSSMQGTNEFGIGATVDSLRANTSSVMRL